jgi:hypothetical protein
MAAEHAALEHLQAGNCQALAASICTPVLLAFVRPRITSTGIEENGNQEEIQQAAAELRMVSGLTPALEQLGNAVSTTNVEVLPAAVRRNRGIVWSKVTLEFEAVSPLIL